jgi:hypothetical protein
MELYGRILKSHLYLPRRRLHTQATHTGCPYTQATSNLIAVCCRRDLDATWVHENGPGKMICPVRATSDSLSKSGPECSKNVTNVRAGAA